MSYPHNGQGQNSELLNTIDQLDQLLKSQINQGGNSAVTNWAGSQHGDTTIPSNVPDGTNYQPPSPISHKSLQECTTEELQHYIQMRKSGIPNPRAAEAEICQLPGITTYFCKSCHGAGKDAMSKSQCGGCGGHGILFEYPNEQIARKAMLIADSYNCGPNSQPSVDMGKGQNHNEGGARATKNPDGSSVPKDMTENIDVKTDDSGIPVAKGGGEEDEEYMKSMLGTQSEVMGTILETLKSMQGQLNHTQQMSTVNAQVTQGLAKSLGMQGQPAQSQHMPQRAPMAQGPGLRFQPHVEVMTKGQMPMGQDDLYQQQQQAQPPTAQEWNYLKKSASLLVHEGRLGSDVVLKMDVGVSPSHEVMAMIRERAGLQPQQQYSQ